MGRPRQSSTSRARIPLICGSLSTINSSRSTRVPRRACRALGELEAAPADDWNELARLDLHLHEVLVRSTGSKRLARMFDTLAAETQLCMVALESFYPERADLVTEHAEIVQAIQRRDAAAATRLSSAT